ncbi:hypothetical protein GXW82_10045 [Streptacidiphilus sp. 4-A2]|nr:hypothetical protein [Streptacidiphilus sp. 4-A2]
MDAIPRTARTPYEFDLLAQAQGTTVPGPPTTLVSMFEEQAARTPHAPAAVCGTVTSFVRGAQRPGRTGWHGCWRPAASAPRTGSRCCCRATTTCSPHCWRSSSAVRPMSRSTPGTWPGGST